MEPQKSLGILELAEPEEIADLTRLEALVLVVLGVVFAGQNRQETLELVVRPVVQERLETAAVGHQLAPWERLELRLEPVS